jgi:hypothetical protein
LSVNGAKFTEFKLIVILSKDCAYVLPSMLAPKKKTELTTIVAEIKIKFL